MPKRIYYKLTLVSIYHQGQERAVFAQLPLGENGRPYIPNFEWFLPKTGLYIPRGSTFSIG